MYTTNQPRHSEDNFLGKYKSCSFAYTKLTTYDSTTDSISKYKNKNDRAFSWGRPCTAKPVSHLSTYHNDKKTQTPTFHKIYIKINTLVFIINRYSR